MDGFMIMCTVLGLTNCPNLFVEKDMHNGNV